LYSVRQRDLLFLGRLASCTRLTLRKESAGQRGRGMDKWSLGQMNRRVSSRLSESCQRHSLRQLIGCSVPPRLSALPHIKPCKDLHAPILASGRTFCPRVIPLQEFNTTHNILRAQTKHQRQGTIHALLVLRPTSIKS
jgi:hypothetical protein